VFRASHDTDHARQSPAPNSAEPPVGPFAARRASVFALTPRSQLLSVVESEAAVIRHFQERMPHGLFVPNVP
jgi:hypothetical protein